MVLAPVARSCRASMEDDDQLVGLGWRANSQRRVRMSGQSGTSTQGSIKVSLALLTGGQPSRSVLGPSQEGVLRHGVVRSCRPRREARG